jgi:hypothetical protein
MFPNKKIIRTSPYYIPSLKSFIALATFLAAGKIGEGGAFNLTGIGA